MDREAWQAVHGVTESDLVIHAQSHIPSLSKSSLRIYSAAGSIIGAFTEKHTKKDNQYLKTKQEPQ